MLSDFRQIRGIRLEYIYKQTYAVSAEDADSFGRLKPSAILWFAQEIAGEHCIQLGTDWDTLQKKNLFWALIRTKVEITRLPQLGETVTVHTWPMPQTRTAYPRCTVGYDAAGQECFRVIALWVLMDTQTRAMVLPGKCQIQVDGILQGTEPELPRALPAAGGQQLRSRTVTDRELDKNLHMNNTRYLDWVMELPEADFSEVHPVKEFTVCYLSEACKDQQVDLVYDLQEGVLQVDGYRAQTDVPDRKDRIFAARLQF